MENALTTLFLILLNVDPRFGTLFVGLLSILPRTTLGCGILPTLPFALPGVPQSHLPQIVCVLPHMAQTSTSVTGFDGIASCCTCIPSWVSFLITGIFTCIPS